MKILITGGTGLIGSSLTKDLLKFGHEVIVLSRSPEKNKSQLDDIRILGWDAHSTLGWGEIINEVDAVINLAGSPLNGNGPMDIWLTPKRKKILLESRLNATGALVTAIREAKSRPKVFIQASAIGYYGPRDDALVDENQSSGDDFLAFVQFQSERSTDILETMDINRIVIRTGLILGKSGSALDYFKLQFSLFSGGRIGSGNQFYSWIHLQDEVSAIRFLLEEKAGAGAYNLVSPNPVRNKDFAKILGKVMRRPAVFVIPGFLMKLVLGEISSVILEGQNVSSKKLESLGFSYKYPELHGALESLF